MTDSPQLFLNLQKFTEVIHKKYGYDFGDYAVDSFQRRLGSFMIRFGILDLDELETKLLEDEIFFNRFLEEITVNVTEMFRDPEFFLTLRTEILPKLADQSLIRIWNAGCSTGEEVYSVAILLHEANLLEKSLLYATDINQLVLEKAASRKFPLERMAFYQENYEKSGGQKKLSDYYTPEGNQVQFSSEIRSRMVFSPHNLVADKSFNEFNLILCRNVLIYFNRDLQNTVVRLFSDSLGKGSFLALGSKEGIDFSYFKDDFESFDRRRRIWQKK